MVILIDAMGGDNAPMAIVEGAIRAGREFGVEIVLIGDEGKIGSLVANEPNIRVVHASEEITCNEEPVAAVKKKKNSSMVIGLKMIKNGEGDAFVSAGSTGALLAGATLHVGRIKGVKRMALAALLPCQGGSTLLIDAGSNMDCRPEFLQQFAFMGGIYVEKVCGVKKPRIGLLSVGAEEQKGDELTRQTHQLLKEMDINFVGNVEAREVPFFACDVLVCDGFAGNVLLKMMEGMGSLFGGMIKKMFTKNILTKFSALLAKDGLTNIKKTMDYSSGGGAPLLGADGVIFKAHGNADATTIYYAVQKAITFAATEVNKEIVINLQN